MNAAELLEAVRARLDDSIGGPTDKLWSDTEIIRDYANPVRNRMFLACRRMITDSSTASDLSTVPLPLCGIVLKAGVASYDLSPRIIRITRMKLVSQRDPLVEISATDLDARYPGWEEYPPGKPWGFCLDLDTDAVTFIPAPLADDAARLSVFRHPLKPIALPAVGDVSAQPDLGFREEYHADLIPGILEMAFSKKDSQTDSPALSALEGKRFAARVEDIRLELQKRTATTHTNKPRKAFSNR